MACWQPLKVMRISSESRAMPFLYRPIEQIAAQGFVAAGRTKLHEGFQVPAFENFAATLAKLLDRKKLFRRPRAGKVDRCSGPGAGRR